MEKKILANSTISITNGACCGFGFFSFIILFLTLIFLGGGGFVIFLIGCKQVGYQYYGLNQNWWTHYIDYDTVYDPGFYFVGYTNNLIFFPKLYQSIGFSSLPTDDDDELKIRTFDGLPIILEISFQYKLQKQNVGKMFKILGPNYKNTLVSISNEVLKNIGSKYNTTDYLESREQMAIHMKQYLQIQLNPYFVNVEYLQLRKITFPKRFETAIENKEILHQKIIKAQRERIQDIIIAETDVLLAKKNAEIKLNIGTVEAESIVKIARANANGTVMRIKSESENYQKFSTTVGFDKQQYLSFMFIKAISNHNDDRLTVNIEKPKILK